MEITNSHTSVMNAVKLLEKKTNILNMKRSFIKDYIVENVIFSLNLMRVMEKFVKIRENHLNTLDSLKKVKTHKLVIVQENMKNS